ncbi:hypothetical protein [Hathewaya massiliensis]|uniref:hypothetical protein n=1 Tax=Hathewaya massiliensis TaxID=1964382 RepID=UPI00163B7AA1|nr:hypothetical protein [Hathewaya massiliensis]
MENKLTPYDHMLETVKLLERRKKARKKAEKEAEEHSIDNTYRVKSQLYHSRINKLSRY